MKAFGLAIAASLAASAAAAQTSGAPHPGTYYIAPGSPSTIGRGGAVTGVVPGQVVPAPQGSMATFGGLFGTGAPRSDANTSTAAAPAVTSSNANLKTSAAPVSGANSFSSNEARRRITAGGFTAVTGLQKDRNGVWRGKAMRDGAPVSVFCDYQGNVGAS